MTLAVWLHVSAYTLIVFAHPCMPYAIDWPDAARKAAERLAAPAFDAAIAGSSGGGGAAAAGGAGALLDGHGSVRVLPAGGGINAEASPTPAPSPPPSPSGVEDGGGPPLLAVDEAEMHEGNGQEANGSEVNGSEANGFAHADAAAPEAMGVLGMPRALDEQPDSHGLLLSTPLHQQLESNYRVDKLTEGFWGGCFRVRYGFRVIGIFKTMEEALDHTCLDLAVAKARIRPARLSGGCVTAADGAAPSPGSVQPSRQGSARSNATLP